MRRSRLVAYIGSLLLAAGLTLTGAASAQASDQRAAAGGYVALGDSYSSGVGAGSYISSSGDCDRSTNAAAYLWNAAHKPASFAFNACSGATTDDVLANQLGSLNSSTSLVSISIGGNDAGFSSVITKCAYPWPYNCTNDINNAISFMQNTLPGRLDFADSPFAGWLRDRLERQSAFVCVDRPAELAQHAKALTIAGQVSNGGAVS